jgi:hypothetical protein
MTVAVRADPVRADRVARALDQRLTVAAAVLRPQLQIDDGEPGHVAADWLSDLLAAVDPRPGPSAWLLMTAVTGAFAGAPDVEWLGRRLELDPPDAVAFDLLDRVRNAVPGASPDAEAQLVSDRVVVDVARSSAGAPDEASFSKLVTECLSHWSVDHAVLAVMRSPHQAAFLTTHEPRRLVIPWRSTVLLIEPPDVSMEWYVPSVAQYSGNRVGVIGHDVGPIVAPRGHTMGPARRFARYLAEVKHADVIVAVDAHGARGFTGFGKMLPAQGLAAPPVTFVASDDADFAALAWAALVDGELPR